jgi:hypothetical protein
MRHLLLAPVLDWSMPLAHEGLQIHRCADGLAAVVTVLARHPGLRITVAIAGSVTRALLRYGASEPLRLLSERASDGQVAFLSTAAHGAFLPLLPIGERARQLQLNDAQNVASLGDFVFRPVGLFPPHLGYGPGLVGLAATRGLRFLVLDELAYSGGERPLPRDRHFRVASSPVQPIFLDRQLSARIAGGLVVHAAQILDAFHGRRGHVAVRIPGRTLGPSGPGLALLLSAANHRRILPALLDDVCAAFPEVEAVEPVACALGTERKDLADGVPSPRFGHPGNVWHSLMWRLVTIAAREAERLSREASNGSGGLRACLDEALDSAAWSAGAGRPELDFDLERVREGARLLVGALRAGQGSVRREALEDAEAILEGLSERRPAREDRPLPASQPTLPA